MPPTPFFVISKVINLHFDDKRKISNGRGNSNESKVEKKGKETGTIEPKALVLIDILKQLRQIYSAVKLIT